MIIIDVEQGSDEWRKARLGCVTASRVADLLLKTKAGKYSAKRNDYLVELVCERLTGEDIPVFENFEMRWGLEKEPDAADLYGFTRDVEPMKVGLVKHPEIERALASPDRLIGDEGMIEIKCPKSTTHVNYMMTEEVPPEYQLQVFWQLACTGRSWCDFVSFDPRMPGNAQLFVKRITMSPDERAAIEADIVAFLHEVEAMELAISNRIEA